ncbi:hypothetical protein DPX16_23640 [Anabarilius grahami]|uniref:Uncharacterized protein n=1 Tax=Anabarilius grahami TaxID=495550 RepID=A0A3N0ZB40_ANAGA|nr:hypothetical protein DPX16_23640 [Anabarilius grahami]
MTDAVRGRCDRRADTCLVFPGIVDGRQTRSRPDTETLTGDEENTGRRGECGRQLTDSGRRRMDGKNDWPWCSLRHDCRTSEHSSRNLLQSSAEPEKGSGLAMALATAGGEGEAAGNAEVCAGGVVVGVLESMRRISIPSFDSQSADWKKKPLNTNEEASIGSVGITERVEHG